MRKEVPMVITVLAGLLLIFAQFFYYGSVLDLKTVTDKWNQISLAFAVLVGVLNLTRLHYTNVKRRRENWVYSLILVVAMWAYILLGLYQTTEGVAYRWIWDAVVTPLSSTMYGMIAFFITTAAYRAFRIRTKEATVLMIVAVIVALGQAPIGDVMIPGWNTFQQWIVDYPASGALRGIALGAFVGSLATGLRILLGLERAHMGGV